MDQCAIKIKKQRCDVDWYGHNVVFFQNLMICSADLLGQKIICQPRDLHYNIYDYTILKVSLVYDILIVWILKGIDLFL